MALQQRRDDEGQVERLVGVVAHGRSGVQVGRVGEDGGRDEEACLGPLLQQRLVERRVAVPAVGEDDQGQGPRGSRRDEQVGDEVPPRRSRDRPARRGGPGRVEQGDRLGSHRVGRSHPRADSWWGPGRRRDGSGLVTGRPGRVPVGPGGPRGRGHRHRRRHGDQPHRRGRRCPSVPSPAPTHSVSRPSAHAAPRLLAARAVAGTATLRLSHPSDGPGPRLSRIGARPGERRPVSVPQCPTRWGTRWCRRRRRGRRPRWRCRTR